MILDVHLGGEAGQVGVGLVEAVRHDGLRHQGEAGRGDLEGPGLQLLQQALHLVLHGALLLLVQGGVLESIN